MRKTLISGIMLAVFAAPALALDTVDVTLNGFGFGVNTSVSSNAGSSYSTVFSGFTQGTFANSTSVDAVDGVYELFCLQLLQSIGFGNSNTFVIQPTLAGVIPDGPPGAMSVAAESAVFNMYASTNGSQYLTNLDAQAFQLALWDITFDFDGTAGSLGLSTGNFRARNLAAPVIAAFGDYVDLALNGVGDPTELTLGLQSLKVQDLAFSIPGGRDIPCVDCDLPEPGTLGLLGLGMIGLAGRRKLLSVVKD